MKLIYITNSRIPTEKAHGFQVMKMCEAFSNTGVELELWIPGRFNQIKENPFSYYGIRKTFGIKRIPVIDFMPLEKFLGPIVGLIESISFAIFILFYLPKKDMENVIYSRDQFICWFLSFLNRKFVYEIIESNCFFPKNRILNKILNPLLKDAISFTTIVGRKVPFEYPQKRPDIHNPKWLGFY